MSVQWGQSGRDARLDHSPACDPKATGMRFDDRTADRQAHSGALGFGGEERVEDPALLLGGQAYSGIADSDENAAPLAEL